MSLHATTLHSKSLAIFIDGDNFNALGMIGVFQRVRELFPESIVISKRIYGDFAEISMSPWRDVCIDNNLQTIQCWRRNQKNAVDMKMACDIHDMIYQRPDVQTYVLCTGDRDFIEVIQRIHYHGKRVIGISTNLKGTSKSFQTECDHFEYVRLEASTPPPPPPPPLPLPVVAVDGPVLQPWLSNHPFGGSFVEQIDHRGRPPKKAKVEPKLKTKTEPKVEVTPPAISPPAPSPQGGGAKTDRRGRPHEVPGLKAKTKAKSPPKSLVPLPVQEIKPLRHGSPPLGGWSRPIAGGVTRSEKRQIRKLKKSKDLANQQSDADLFDGILAREAFQMQTFESDSDE